MDNYLDKVLDGRYEIREIIGTGGMAVVYKAHDRKLNRDVAVKILKSDLRSDTELRRRFHAESEAVARLNSPYVISVFDVSSSDAVDYFVMELIDGITLKQYINQRQTLSPKEALHFTVQILRGIEHAHANKIIHRDIKPQNIMILRDGTAKVTDFGIARIAGKDTTMAQDNVFGSVHYIAPEQARCDQTDGRADIYSVGIMLYEMLTGRLPYNGDSPVEIAMQHINAKPIPPRQINPDIPPALEAITLKAMCADLNKRYATATEMIEDIEAYRRDPAHFMPRTAELPAKADGGGAKPPEKGSAEPEKGDGEKKVKVSTRKFNYMPLVAALLILLLVGAAVAALWITILSGGSGTEDIKVPSVIGRTYDDVSSDSSLDFNFVVADSRFDSVYDKGVIVEQDQLVGKTVKAGSTINVTLSLGKRIEKLPDYTNWLLKDAQSDLLKLMEKTVTIKQVFEPSSSVTRNYVIRTNPLPEQTITEGDVITLYISSGPETETIEMPNLIGKTEAQARVMLGEASLEIGTVSRELNDNVAEGTVINQSTPAHTLVPKGQVIDFVVSYRTPETTATTEATTEATSASAVTDATTVPPATDATAPYFTLLPEQTTDGGGTTASDETPDGYIDWVLMLPSGMEYPDQMYIEVLCDGATLYADTVDKALGSMTFRLKGEGSVKLEVYIDTSLYSTQDVPLS